MPPPDADRRPEGLVPFEAIYDADTLAALDAWAPPRGTAAGPRDPVGRPSSPPPPGSAGSPGRIRWRGLTAGVALNAMVLGVGEALSDEGGHEAIVELRPELPVDERQPVTFLMVPGLPRASRVIVRPWLLAG